MITPVKILLIFFLLQASFVSFSQVITPPPTDTSINNTSKTDTVKEFEIIRGPSMRSINIDSTTTLQTIAGGAIVKQGTTIFNADSIAINPTTHIAEGFGNVHINQADSIQTYAQYLKYIGTEKTAYLQKDVKLVDKKATLFTQALDYNLGTGIGNYHNGGKVINGKTTITSNDGTYYADTKDIYFKNDVVVNEPKNHVTTDSLLYNMQTQNYNLNGNTYIKSKEAEIFTTEGSYDFKSDNALFTSRTTVKDTSGRIYIANNMAMDNKSGSAQMEGNALVRDSAGGYTVLANQIFLNKKTNSFLATRKPVLIIKQKDDSIYVAADTIFSGFSTAVKNEEFILKKDSVANDSINRRNIADTAFSPDSLHRNAQLKKYSGKDSAIYLAHIIDSLDAIKNNEKIKQVQKVKENPVLKDSIKAISPHKDSMKIDSIKTEIFQQQIKKIAPVRESLRSSDSVHIIGQKSDSLAIDSPKKNITTADIRSLDSLNKGKNDSVKKPDSSRYFLAFHHVRIFSDSLQSVCDSLFFSAKDSVFRLYYDPVIWSGHSQITGDTIFLYTKNKKPERLYAFEKGIIINRTTQGFYNQISGKTINGYFVNGKIDYMRVRGSQAESVYYAQDKDSAYLGMNRATGDVIDLYFVKDDLEKVLFVNDVTGKFYPMKGIPQDQRYLKDFIWLDEKRPKNKLELFE
ncbi:MAG TPA: OstA-like protein [Ginsengibacter sp.]|nr:OstA-like protein [Ginsengibacter sp.]